MTYLLPSFLQAIESVCSFTYLSKQLKWGEFVPDPKKLVQLSVLINFSTIYLKLAQQSFVIKLCTSNDLSHQWRWVRVVDHIVYEDCEVRVVAEEVGQLVEGIASLVSRADADAAEKSTHASAATDLILGVAAFLVVVHPDDVLIRQIRAHLKYMNVQSKISFQLVKAIQSLKESLDSGEVEWYRDKEIGWERNGEIGRERNGERVKEEG